MKKRGLLLLVIFLLTGVLFAGGIRNDASSRSGEIILLHTNDLHGRVLPNGGVGGYSQLAAFVNQVRAVNKNVLLLDAGDFNTGTALSNIFNAEPDIRAMSLMGYDAVTFGNHEFNGGRDRINTQIGQAEFPFVSSNVRTTDGSFLGGNQYIVKRFGGISVGIFGITTLRALNISNPGSSLVFIDELEAAREVVNILRNRERVDIIIALTHMGDLKETDDHVTSVMLAESVRGIDIIVDGHSHTYMQAPIRAGDTWVVSANEWGKYMGYGKLTVRDGKLTDFNWAPVPIGHDMEVTAMLNPFIERADATFKEVIGRASSAFLLGNRLPRFQETAIGNMICDANAWFFRSVNNQQIDFAFHNGGNIRADIPAGPITREHILTTLPFDNYLYIVSMSGSEILELFNFIATIPQGNGGFPQFSSEVRYTIDKTRGDGVITQLTIGGAPVDPNRMYRFCTNDFILGGGDGYAVMSKARAPYNTSLLLSYVVSEYIRAQGGVINPALDGRLTVVGGISP